jgi:hypothetical protein
MGGKRPLDAVTAALAQARRAGRSPLYRWMRDRHDRLLKRLDGERPDWQALAEAFAQLGLTDRTGKPPAPETARKTWLTVRRDVAADRAKRAQKPPPPAPLEPDEIAPGVRAVFPAAPDAPRPKLDIRPARPIADLPPAPPSPKGAPFAEPSSMPAAASPDAGDQLRRLREAMAARVTPAPKPVD